MGLILKAVVQECQQKPSGRQGPVKVGGFVTFFAERHRFPLFFSTADSSLTLGMTRENSSVK
jgi:hypothetical protein